MSVDIVMATYNGAKFLTEQLDSLVAQDYKDWRLLIRDDGSTDKTTDIIHRYAVKHPGKIVFLDNKETKLGPGSNFGALLNATTADYVMCADQDDAWLKDKISVTLARMKEMEAVHGTSKPLLVHTDSKVCDVDMNITHDSLHAVWKSDPKAHKFERMLVQPQVQGCTTLFNRELVKNAMPVPKNALMHDAWLGMVAGATGEVGYLDKPTLHYRQHDANVFGAGTTPRPAAPKKTWEQKVTRVGEIMDRNIEQAKLLLEQVGDKMPADRLKVLQDFVKLPEEPRFVKGAKLLAHGHLRNTLKTNVAMLFWR